MQSYPIVFSCLYELNVGRGKCGNERYHLYIYTGENYVFLPSFLVHSSCLSIFFLIFFCDWGMIGRYQFGGLTLIFMDGCGVRRQAWNEGIMVGAWLVWGFWVHLAGGVSGGLKKR